MKKKETTGYDQGLNVLVGAHKANMDEAPNKMWPLLDQQNFFKLQ